MTFWNSAIFHEYERLCGDEPGTRARLLAESDWMTRVVDLTPDRSTLWAGVRRSYHSIVNGLDREFLSATCREAIRLWGPPDSWMTDACGERDVIDGSGAGWVVRTCELVHKAAAGRQTRYDEAWQLMGEWAEAERGLFVVAFDWTRHPLPELVAANPLMASGQPLDMGEALPCVGFVFFVRRGNWAYYFSAASLRSNINIALVWWAMLALKARGVRWCELGWQGEAKDDKGKQIEFFRRGFGGFDIPAKEAPCLANGGGLHDCTSRASD